MKVAKPGKDTKSRKKLKRITSSVRGVTQTKTNKKQRQTSVTSKPDKK